MEIRTAVPADLEQIRQYDCHIPLDKLADCINRGLVDVLVCNGKIVGILRWNLFWQDLPFVDLIFLDDALRGQGWGTKLVEHWERSMASRGHRHVLLSTQSDESARYFYEKLGYTCCGSFLPPEQKARELIYRKTL